CTVHAPHNAIPQPNFVPVKPRTSRSTHNSGVSPSTSTLCMVPLTLMENAMTVLSDQIDGNVDGTRCFRQTLCAHRRSPLLVWMEDVILVPHHACPHSAVAGSATNLSVAAS